MTTEKSFLDKMFDIADSATEALEKGLKPAEADPKVDPNEPIDVEFRDVKDDRHKDWEQTWKTNIVWGVAMKGKLGEAHHAFREGFLVAQCGESFRADEVEDRKRLEPGKRYVMCTTCVNMESRHG